MKKDIFSLKKTFSVEKNKPTMCRLDLAWAEKGEGVLDSTNQKATSSFCRELLLNPHYEFGEQTEGKKN